MICIEKKHELREHLSIISTSAYFLLECHDEKACLERYKRLQSEIDSIIHLLDEEPHIETETFDEAFH